MQAKAVIQSSVVGRQSSETSASTSARRLAGCREGVSPSQQNGHCPSAIDMRAYAIRTALVANAVVTRLRRFSLQARTQQLSFNVQSIQKLRVSRRKSLFD